MSTATRDRQAMPTSNRPLVPKMAVVRLIGQVPSPTREALASLEAAATRAVDLIAAWARQRWALVEVDRCNSQRRNVNGTIVVESIPAEIFAQPWDVVVCSVDAQIALPESTAANRATEICVAKVGNPTVDVRPIRGLIDGTNASSGPAANRRRTWISTGNGWYSDG